MSLDVPQLRTASTYINNLLLARGLLRNGKAIDFAALGAAERRGQDAKTGVKHAELAAEVINLVHDMILRRDRETEQSTALSETLADLRATASTQSGQLDRLKAQNKDLNRQLDIAQSSLRSAHTTFHTAELSAKALKEELTKVKATLAQVRTQCANDVRKRDVQLQRLKTHLSSSQRGSNGRMVGPTCTIKGGNTIGRGTAQGLGAAAWSGGAGSGRGEEEAAPSLEDAGYSLKQETTEFLTQLSQNLSDENDSLISLVRSTLTTLRELQNLPPDSALVVMDNKGDSTDDGLVHVVPTSFATLSTDLEYVLGNLKVILTNASFVPIDEVYARDEEINRLREGWERMESRWREAVDMMKGWQTRMMSGGGNVNLEELKLGLGLGDGLQHLSDFPTPLSPNSADSENADEDNDMATPDLPEDEPSFAAEDENFVLATRGDADDHLFEVNDSPLSSNSRSAVLKEGTANIKIVSLKSTPATQSLEQENVGSTKSSLNAADLATKGASTPLQSAASKPGSRKEASARDKKLNAVQKPTELSSPTALTQSARTSTPKPRNNSSNGASAARSRSQRPVAPSPATKTTPRAASPVLEPEPPLTIEEKLQHAELEARRISGSSISDSPCPSPARAGGEHEEADIPNTAAPKSPDIAPEEPQAQPADATPAPAATEDRAGASEPKSRARTVPSGAGTAPREARPATTKSRATGPTAASRAGTLPKRGRTTTTRIPTKPPAPDVAATRKKNVPTHDAEGEVEPLVEAAMRRSRRKRKSTLSPEELEELMGLRNRAEAEAQAAAAAADE